MKASQTHIVRTLVLCAGFAVSLGVADRSQAQLSWNNAAGGNAAAAANWTPNQVPGALDDLVFNLNNTFPVTWNATVPASRMPTTAATISSGGDSRNVTAEDVSDIAEPLGQAQRGRQPLK